MSRPREFAEKGEFFSSSSRKKRKKQKKRTSTQKKIRGVDPGKKRSLAGGADLGPGPTPQLGVIWAGICIWVAPLSAQVGEIDEDEFEPPVPPPGSGGGLHRSKWWLLGRISAAFIRGCLIEVCRRRAPRLGLRTNSRCPSHGASRRDSTCWLPAARKNEYLVASHREVTIHNLRAECVQRLSTCATENLNPQPGAHARNCGRPAPPAAPSTSPKRTSGRSAQSAESQRSAAFHRRTAKAARRAKKRRSNALSGRRAPPRRWRKVDARPLPSRSQEGYETSGGNFRAEVSAAISRPVTQGSAIFKHERSCNACRMQHKTKAALLRRISTRRWLAPSDR